MSATYPAYLRVDTRNENEWADDLPAQWRVTVSTGYDTETLTKQQALAFAAEIVRKAETLPDIAEA
jgi:hypothetical protein